MTNFNNKTIDVLSSTDTVKEHVGNRKVKKFFRITIPILLLEILAIIGLGVYLLLLPKNYCKVMVNVPGATVYVNNKSSNKFRLQTPDKATDYYFYEVDISVKLPGNEVYSVTYSVECDKCVVGATTTAVKNNDVYSMNIVGGEKTQILSALTLKSSKKIKNFNITIKVTAQKV